jgi:hypothetical protein
MQVLEMSAAVSAPPRVGVGAFVQFMRTRHQIYLDRSKGTPYPWTADPVLREYSFCNVYRELDTVTKWVAANIRAPYWDSPHLWFLLCVARQINWPDTLAEILTSKALPTGAAGKYDPHKMRLCMLHRAGRGEKVYTGAYMINAAFGNLPNVLHRDKPYFTAFLTLLPLWDNRKAISAMLERPGCTLQEATEHFATYHGWGGFMGYEVACDLRHTRYLDRAPDISTWANTGPGALRGLNRIWGRPLEDGWPKRHGHEEMRLLLPLVHAQWPRGKQWPRLEMREIEHSLCEFDKYERARLGEGRPRAKYHPRNTTQMELL